MDFRVWNPSLLVSVCLLATGSIHAQQAPPTSARADLANEEKAIRDLNTRWLQAVEARDAAEEAALFAADGVAYREGVEPRVGPAVFQAARTNFLAENPRAHVTWSTDNIEIAQSRDLAVQTGEVRITGLRSQSEGEIIRRRYVVVWKKVDGDWKVAHDIGATLPAAPP